MLQQADIRQFEIKYFCRLKFKELEKLNLMIM